jgi:glycosyltransferase involved in cell wall biosynthesis
MRLDIVYLAWNRLDFTKMSFELLRENTNWDLVDRLIVYDDGSEDGTAEYLANAGRYIGVPAFDFRQVNFNSPPMTMNDYLALSEAKLFAKIDNDILVPPFWLEAMLAVMRRNPTLELLGMEAARTGPPVKNVAVTRHHYEPARWIGGVGLMRTRSFHIRPAISGRGRFGFTEWQKRHNPQIGWIAPDLRVLQLDRLPFQPWQHLSKMYVQRGWQREWPDYDTLQPWWWEWMKKRKAA